MSLFSLLLGSALWVAPAQAAPQEVPAWAWRPGQPALFHIETAILSPRGLKYAAVANLDAYATVLQIQADTTCVAAAEGKGFAVTCTFAHLNFRGQSLQDSEKDELKTILAEYSARTLPTTVILHVSPDGRIKEFDHEGLDRPNDRVAGINDQIRTLLYRTFSLLDLKLPPAGDDWVRGWSVTNVTPILYLPTSSGTLGSAALKYTPKGADEGLYSILYGGKATVAEGAAIEAGNRSLDARVAGTILWDLQIGLPAYRDLTIELYRTSSSDSTGSGAEYGFICALQRVEAFNADGSAPLSIAAQRAPKVRTPPPEPPAGVPLVTFAELGMQPLFVPSMPEEGRMLQLQRTTMKARVQVDATGKVTSATATDGFLVLALPTEQALKSARFVVYKDAPYAVDVEVEFRTE